MLDGGESTGYMPHYILSQFIAITSTVPGIGLIAKQGRTAKSEKGREGGSSQKREYCVGTAGRRGH